MLSQTDIFDRAEECECAIGRAGDSQHKIAFERLRDMLVAVANEAPFLPSDLLAEQLESVERIFQT